MDPTIFLFPGGIVGMVFCLLMYLRRQDTGQRAIRAAKAHLTPEEDIAAGYAAVEASVKALRAAKNEEQALLMRHWQNDYMALLPDTDPEKATHQAKLQGVKIETANFALDNNGMRAKNIQQPETVPDGPDWMPLPQSRNKEDDELTYSQRRIQRAGAFVRKSPSTSAPTYGVANGGSVVRFDGYVRGEPVAGNSIWFVYYGLNSKLPKYIHSIATTNRSTAGLPDLTDDGSGITITRNGITVKDEHGHTTFQSSPYIQMPVAEVARLKEADRLSRSLETRRGKYDPVPKEFIPASRKKVWY